MTPFLSYGPVQLSKDTECGSNDDLVPALTLAVTIYFKGLRCIFLSLFQFLCQTRNNSEELSFQEKVLLLSYCELTYILSIVGGLTSSLANVGIYLK